MRAILALFFSQCCFILRILGECSTSNCPLKSILILIHSMLQMLLHEMIIYRLSGSLFGFQSFLKGCDASITGWQINALQIDITSITCVSRGGNKIRLEFYCLYRVVTEKRVEPKRLQWSLSVTQFHASRAEHFLAPLFSQCYVVLFKNHDSGKPCAGNKISNCIK